MGGVEEPGLECPLGRNLIHKDIPGTGEGLHDETRCVLSGKPHQKRI